LGAEPRRRRAARRWSCEAPNESNEPKLLNRPSDGHDLPISMSFERAVACAVGVEIVEPKK
jgi:hypothetical protein